MRWIILCHSIYTLPSSRKILEHRIQRHFKKEVFKHKAIAIFSKGRLLLGRVWLCSECTTFWGFKKLESEELSTWSHVVRKTVWWQWEPSPTCRIGLTDCWRNERGNIDELLRKGQAPYALVSCPGGPENGKPQW